jgi:hypothetical protein
MIDLGVEALTGRLIRPGVPTLDDGVASIIELLRVNGVLSQSDASLTESLATTASGPIQGSPLVQ